MRLTERSDENEVDRHNSGKRRLEKQRRVRADTMDPIREGEERCETLLRPKMRRIRKIIGKAAERTGRVPSLMRVSQRKVELRHYLQSECVNKITTRIRILQENAGYVSQLCLLSPSAALKTSKACHAKEISHAFPDVWAPQI